MGLIWVRQDPGGPHVGPIKFAIWACLLIKGPFCKRFLHRKTIFCTCHDSTAVVACSKFLSYHFATILMRVECNFHWFWILIVIVREMGSWCQYSDWTLHHYIYCSIIEKKMQASAWYLFHMQLEYLVCNLVHARKLLGCKEAYIRGGGY